MGGELAVWVVCCLFSLLCMLNSGFVVGLVVIGFVVWLGLLPVNSVVVRCVFMRLMVYDCGG